MDSQMLEYYHDNGQMPDRYYNQLNGKSAQENYDEWRNKRFRICKKKFSFMEDFLLAMLKSCLDVALKEVMDGIIPKK